MKKRPTRHKAVLSKKQETVRVPREVTGTGQPVTPDPGILECNLLALEKVDPALAGRLRSPSTADWEAIPALTRDGRISFRLVRPDGSWEWFGRTSIPTVRAEAVIARSDIGHANVLLSSIGEGTEAALLVRKLGRHRALFVWEQDLAALHLALRLHNLADAIASERFVPFVCSLTDLAQTLTGWLNEHRGHLCPDRLLMWPWQTVVGLNPCRIAVENAAQAVDRTRRHALQELRAQPHAKSRRHIALLATNADENTLETVEAMKGAAVSLGLSTIDLAIRGPRDVHPLARAMRLAEAGLPEQALLIDAARKEICDVLPDDVVAVTWLTGRIPIRSSTFNRFGPDEAVAVIGSRRRDQLIAAGVDAGRVHVCPPACTAPTADGEPMPGPEERPVDLLVLADLSPLDAGGPSGGLATHARIWKTALDLLRDHIETFTDEQAADLLAMAEKKAGATLEDAALRQAAIEHLAHSAANSLAWPFFTEAVSRFPLSLEIRGTGWPAPTRPLDGPTERHSLLSQAKMLLHLDAAGEVPAQVMAAAGKGAVILARRHPRDRAPGGLATLFEPGDEYLSFAGIDDLNTTLADLLAHPKQLAEIAEKARSRCLSEHMPEHRLADLLAIASP